ncbi:hypothetical protein [Leptotrichia shahii]|uniref:hypothetical protein n=1 Tax=Leptotrichia shahii TaxID=157691 RepID=UPI0028D3053F|nr:hypothetical protein [Leptotrichia shahii]
MLKNVKFDEAKPITDGVIFERRMKEIAGPNTYTDLYTELNERVINKGQEGYVELNNLIDEKLEAKGIDLEDEDAREEIRNEILSDDETMKGLIIKDFDHEYGVKFIVDDLLKKIEEIKDDEDYLEELEELVGELKKYNNPAIKNLIRL